MTLLQNFAGAIDDSERPDLENIVIGGVEGFSAPANRTLQRGLDASSDSRLLFERGD